MLRSRQLLAVTLGLLVLATNANSDDPPVDCNNNGIPDVDDLRSFNSFDCNGNGIPDECDSCTGFPDCNHNCWEDVDETAPRAQATTFATGPDTPEDIIVSPPGFPSGFLAAEGGSGATVRLIPQNGGASTVFAPGSGFLHALCVVPDEYGGLGIRVLTGSGKQLLPNGTLVTIPMAGPADGMVYIPKAIGGPCAGDILAAFQLGRLYCQDSDENADWFPEDFAFNPFSVALSPAKFGTLSNHAFISQLDGSEVKCLDLQNMTFSTFARVPFTTHQVGLRQLAFSPPGWGACFDPTRNAEAVLALSVTSSRSGGGAAGAVQIWSSDARLLAIYDGQPEYPIDPRGLLFAEGKLLVGDTGSGNILALTQHDFRVDCNANGIPDSCDIDSGLLTDCDQNRYPDVCELTGQVADCNEDGVWDDCQIAQRELEDCDHSFVPDICEVDESCVPEAERCPCDVDCDGVLNPQDVCICSPLDSPVYSDGRPLGDFFLNCVVDLVD